MRRLNFAWVIVMLFGAAGNVGGSLNIGTKQTVYTHAQLGAIAQFWPDGSIGTLEGTTFYAATASLTSGNARTLRSVGTLSAIASTSTTALAIGSMKASFDYVAGGHVYKDTPSSTLLLLYHTEHWFNGVLTDFYATLGIAKSTDNGVSWTDCGEIIKPNTPQADEIKVDVKGGTWTIVGDYFYCYYRDRLAIGGTEGLAVARALIADVVSAAVNSTDVTTWHKYHNGGWTELGLGGLFTSLEPGFQSNGWLDVHYNTALEKYFLASIDWTATPNSNIYYATSTDGLTWSTRHLMETENGESTYITIIGPNGETQVTGASFYVYYIYTTAGINRWSDTALVRRLITVRGEN